MRFSLCSSAVFITFSLISSTALFAKSEKKRTAPIETEEAAALEAAEEKAALEEAASSTPRIVERRPFWFGLGAGLPEVTRLNIGYWPTRWLGISLFASPPIPINLNVDTPSIVLNATSTYRLETAPTTLAVKTQYGPQAGLDLYIHPGTETFYLLLGGEYRRVSGTATGEAPLYLCAASSSNCRTITSGRDTGASSTVMLDGKISGVSESMAVRAGFGWFWEFGGDKPSKTRQAPVKAPPYYCDFALGAFVPVYTKRSYTVTAEAESSFSPAVQSAVQKYLDNVISTFQDDVTDELNTELDPYDKSPLPLIELTVGMKI